MQRIFSCLLLYSKHSFASDILIKPATLPWAAGAAAWGTQSLATFLHVTKHITKTRRTKERQQRERDYSGGLGGRRLFFFFSFIASRQTLPNNGNLRETPLIDRLYSLKSPPYEISKCSVFTLDIMGVTVERERISLAVWRAPAGRGNIGWRSAEYTYSGAAGCYSPRGSCCKFILKDSIHANFFEGTHAFFNLYPFEAKETWFGDEGSILLPEWQGGIWKISAVLCMQWEVKSSVHLLIKQFTDQSTIWVEHKLN